MDFKESYPDYAAIEAHIRRARIERSVAVAHLIVDAGSAVARGLRKLAGAISGARQLPARVVGPALREEPAAR